MIRVILCAHNGARYLEEQLASIFEQEWEVDVVHLFDFASTDQTRALAARLSNKWPKLDIREVETAPGVTHSFFHAFREISSICDDDDAIFISDQDDIWLPEKTEIMLSRLLQERTRHADRLLLFHDVRICDADLNPIQKSFYLGRPFRVPRDIALDRLLLANPVIGHTMLVTPSLLRLAVDMLRPRFYVMHDWAVVLVAAYFGKLIHVDRQLSLYRQHEANILGVGTRRSLRTQARRAVELMRKVDGQMRAFQSDIDAAAEKGLVDRHIKILNDATSVTLQICLRCLHSGPTAFHRMMAPLPLFWRLTNYKNGPTR